MCGLAGVLSWNRDVDAETARVGATLMSDALRHRGPDDDGCWVNAEVGIALGFRRLAIVDLSPHGHQPMQSLSGRYVVVFNGEIYNFKAHSPRPREVKARHSFEAIPTLRSCSVRSRSGDLSRLSNDSWECSRLRLGSKKAYSPSGS